MPTRMSSPSGRHGAFRSVVQGSSVIPQALNCNGDESQNISIENLSAGPRILSFPAPPQARYRTSANTY